jgi:predicted RNA binding protein with dsRBD fold (UPF0201 family)
LKIPNIPCKIICSCPIYPSEDHQKILQAIRNIFVDGQEDLEISILDNGNTAKFTSTDLGMLEKISKIIRAKNNQRIYKKYLNLHLDGDSTWFYINKQAAFSDTITMCTEPEESPLQPITIIIQSKNIEGVIDWLVSYD